jgi:hypothetical protein
VPRDCDCDADGLPAVVADRRKPTEAILPALCSGLATQSRCSIGIAGHCARLSQPILNPACGMIMKYAARSLAMICKASQRGGGRQLAAHLLNAHDNVRVEVADMRGSVARDLAGAFKE